MVKKESKKLNKKCACCGQAIDVTLFPDKTYEGGHFFCKLPDKAEYWECEKCYRGEQK
jgi:hypothetical protein